MAQTKSNSASDRDYQTLYTSASSGDMGAQISLGLKYRDGDGVDQDGEKAVEWLTRAAHQGSTTAKFHLGYMFKDGDGVPLNYSKAIEWFQLAADEGDVDSLVWIGNLYLSGYGVPKDPSKAAECYSIAASKGDSYGQSNLGKLYLNGDGVPRNTQKALELFTLSAEQGNEYGLNSLGELYIKEGNYEKGMEYLRQAGEKGHPRAFETLKKIEEVQEKHRIEDSIRKITCPYCGKKSVWKAKFCHGCTARILYSPARRYEWIGIGIAIFSAVIGIAIDPSNLGRVLFLSFLIWPLSLILGRLFGEQHAFFRKD